MSTFANSLSVLSQFPYVIVPVTALYVALRLKWAVCVTVGFASGISSPFGVSFLT